MAQLQPTQPGQPPGPDTHHQLFWQCGSTSALALSLPLAVGEAVPTVQTAREGEAGGRPVSRNRSRNGQLHKQTAPGVFCEMSSNVSN